MANIPPLDGAFYVDPVGWNISHLFKPDKYCGQDIVPLTIEMAVKLIEQKSRINVLTVVVDNNRITRAWINIGVELDCIRDTLRVPDNETIPISFITENKKHDD